MVERAVIFFFYWFLSVLPLRPGGRSYLFSKFPFFIYRNIIPYTLQFFFC